MRYRLDVNGEMREADVPASTTLLDVLREDFGLTGSHLGCGHGACGACYVLVDSEPAASCTMSVEEAEGRHIVTVEGLAPAGSLHPVQQAFVDGDAMECGACTTGMVISAVSLLMKNPHPAEGEILDAMSPHLCRCGAYGRVVKAVQSVRGVAL